MSLRSRTQLQSMTKSTTVPIDQPSATASSHIQSIATASRVIFLSKYIVELFLWCFMLQISLQTLPTTTNTTKAVQPAVGPLFHVRATRSASRARQQAVAQPH